MKKNPVLLFLTFFGALVLFGSILTCLPQSGKAIAEEVDRYANPDKFIKNRLSKADRYYKAGKYHAAVSAWREALEANPGNVKAAKSIKEAEGKIAKIEGFFGSSAYRRFSVPKEFSLEDCLVIAVDNNLQIEAAREQVKFAQMKVWEARRAFLPSLTLSWTRTRGIQSGGKVEGLEYGVEGKQPAFRSGSIMYSLAQAKSAMTIAESNYDKINNELYFEVAKAYYALVKAKKQLEYTEEIYNEVKPFYEIAKKAYEKAVTPTIEFLNVESSFNQLCYQTTSNKNEFEIAKLILEQVLTVEDGEIIDIALDEEPGMVTESLGACLELALENRPDLKMSLHTVKYTEYGKKIADTKEMPSVDLVGNYKKSAEVYREGYQGNPSQALDLHKKWYVGLEGSVPFLGSTASYSYFRRHDPASLSTFLPDSESRGTTLKLDILNNLGNLSEIEQAKIANIRAEQELEDTRKKTIMEVKEAFYGYEKARIQMEAAKSQKEFREKEFKILKFKNSMGETELSEIFNSVSKLLEADTLYCDAEANFNISMAGLNKAIGIENYF